MSGNHYRQVVAAVESTVSESSETRQAVVCELCIKDQGCGERAGRLSTISSTQTKLRHLELPSRQINDSLYMAP
jgi:hypothetical protein